MARIIIGGILVSSPLLAYLVGYFLGFSMAIAGPGIVFWFGVVLIIWGYKARKKDERKGGELNG